MIENYDTINYNGSSIKNISRRFVIESLNIKNTKDVYFEYLIKGWISPENLAYNFYGSCDEVWSIFVINNILNPYTDWLLEERELKDFIIDKYGETNIGNVHHYEKNNIIYKEFIDGAVKVTNYEYEVDVNEKKRKVKLIYPEILETLKKELKDKFSEKV